MTASMTAVVYRSNLPITDPASLVDSTIDRPSPRPHDLIVRVEAVSVNPVDVKQRQNVVPSPAGRVLGFDASGTVVEIGSEVTLFAPGDEVFYAGSIDRPGSDADFHAVDERIVGRKPGSLSHAEAAALPLTAITAWESLFDRLRLSAESTGTILVLGGAGGVGSILIQLTKKLTGLTVIATASRSESRDWALELGADIVVDHAADLVSQVLEAAPDGVEYVFSPHTKGAGALFAEIVKPFGAVVSIDTPNDLDILPLKAKSIAWHWELMFTRPVFGTPDLIEQHRLLNRVSELIDDGTLRGTMTTRLSPINAEQLREAHRLIESGRTVGKVVVSR
jgi:zinc-binding alcohol dehydrogenase family protein